MSGLRLKQKRFTEEYLVDGNATQAAIRSGYSKQAASAIGYENLNKPHIAAIIGEKTAADMALRAAARAEVTLERLSDMFLADRDLAREVKQMSAAVSATDKLARLHGHMIDRSERRTLTLDMSDDDLAEIVRALQRQAPPLLTAAVVSVGDTQAVTPAKVKPAKSLKRKTIRKTKR
jgi:phage terminase small subunit